MNEAIFIDVRQMNGKIKKVRDLQNEIGNSLRNLEIYVGTIAFQQTEGKYESVLIVDEDLLNQYCEIITESVAEIKSLYTQLIQSGVFKQKNPG